MKITIYTITDCQFSKQEKEYLTSHNLPFEEKNLETNKDFLTEMLAVSNNFAGTPVTKIEKDDGQTVVLKGFTEEEFNKTLGYETAAKPTVEPPAETPSTPIPPTPTPPTSMPPEPTTPTPPTPTPPVETPPAVEPPKTEEPPVPPVIEPPGSNSTPTPEPTPTATDPQLSSILNDLQSKLKETPADDDQTQTPPAATDISTPSTPTAPSTPPTIPDPNF